MSGWRDDAACRDETPELFFPPPGDRGTRAQAIAICERCPVILQCRADGAREGHGVFGGVYRWEGRPRGEEVPEPEPREPRDFGRELNGGGTFSETTLEEWDHLVQIGFSDAEAAQALGVQVESLHRLRERRAAA